MNRITNVLMAVLTLTMLGLLLRSLSPASAQSVVTAPSTTMHGQPGKFQITGVGGNLVLLNSQTGETWTKFLGSGEGPTQWKYDTSPKALRQNVTISLP